MDYAEGLDNLVKIRLEPYWDSVGDRVLFRKIAGGGGAYSVTRQSKEQLWAPLKDALAIRTREDAARVRREVRLKLGKT